eukprot:gene4800-6728_t
MEETSPNYSQVLRIDGRDIFVDLQENASGFILKLYEEKSKGRYKGKNKISIPVSCLPQLKVILEEVVVITAAFENSRDRNQTLFVSGLAWETTDQQLHEHFSSVGLVSKAKVMRKYRSGGKKISIGCGLVEFDYGVNIPLAIQQLHGSELNGRTIRCRLSKLDSSSKSNSDSNGGLKMDDTSRNVKSNESSGESEKILDPNKIFITSLAWDVTDEVLVSLFSVVGEVKSASTFRTKKGRSLGHGMVEFVDPASVATSISDFNNKEVNGRAIIVREFFKV